MISLIPLMIAGGFDGVEPMIRIALAPTNGSRMSYAAAARVLGVDVGHLWRVVHGERESKRLCARLRAENIKLDIK